MPCHCKDHRTGSPVVSLTYLGTGCQGVSTTVVFEHGSREPYRIGVAKLRAPRWVNHIQDQACQIRSGLKSLALVADAGHHQLFDRKADLLRFRVLPPCNQNGAVDVPGQRPGIATNEHRRCIYDDEIVFTLQDLDRLSHAWV